MSSEERIFLNLCEQFFSSKNRSTRPLKRFFSKVIQDDSQIPLTAAVRDYIPRLADVDGGVFVNMLTRTIDGINPMHFVPDLKLASPRPPAERPDDKNPRRSQTSRDELHVTDIKLFMNKKLSPDNFMNRTAYSYDISKPSTSRGFYNTHQPRPRINYLKFAQQTYLRPLPPLKNKDNDVIHNLYAHPKEAMYICRKETPVEARVIPPEYPNHKIGKQYAVMMNSGIVSVENKTSEITDLDQYVKDKTDFFLLERNMFKKRVTYHAFYVWRNRCKLQHFDAKIKRLDNINSVVQPGFRNILDKIRGHFLSSTEDLRIFPPDFDVKVDDADYTDLIQTAEKSIEHIAEVTSNLADETARMIAKFFTEVQLKKEMMKLNFQELRDLNSLPSCFDGVISDLKYRTPSIHREFLREHELKAERQFSCSREAYLSKFFKKARAFYNGLLVIKCRDILVDFLTRFDSSVLHETRSTKFVASYDPEKGLNLSPSKHIFMDWMIELIEKIKSAFLTESHQIPLDLITELDPDYNCESDDLYQLLSRYKEIENIYSNVEKSSNDAYESLDKDLDEHRQFLLKLRDVLKGAEEFTEYRNMEKFKQLVETLVSTREELSNKPRNVFHRVYKFSETRTDFVADMKPAWDVANRMVINTMKELKGRVMNELNNNLFTEIQDKFAQSREKKKLSRIDVGAFEARCLMYAIMCTTIVTAWPEVNSDCRATFDTVSMMYQNVANSTNYTHTDAADSYNENAEKMNVAHVHVQDDADYESDDEEEDSEYEYVDEEDVND